MSSYRDELTATRHRVAALEAQLAERDAALHAREAEVTELQAEIKRLRTGTLFAEQQRGSGLFAALLAVAAILLFVVTGAYLSARTDHFAAKTDAERAEGEASVSRAEAVRAGGKLNVESPKEESPKAVSRTIDRFPFNPSASAEIAESGYLTMNSFPESDVSLDGSPLGSTPKVGVPVRAGVHVVTFVHPEHGRKSVTLYVGNREAKTASVEFE